MTGTEGGAGSSKARTAEAGVASIGLPKSWGWAMFLSLNCFWGKELTSPHSEGAEGVHSSTHILGHRHWAWKPRCGP